MFGNLQTYITERIRKRGPTWRLSTWWVSDTEDSMQHSLLRVLSIAHHERLDAAILVDNLADEHIYFYRRRLRKLARRLSSGTPPIAAIEQTPDLLSDDIVLALRFANQTGTLSTTFQQLIDQRDHWTSKAQSSLRRTIAYCGTTTVVAILILTFVAIAILPVFDRILDGFGISTPWVMGSLINVCTHVYQFWPLWILAAFALAWLAWSGRSRRFLRRVIGTSWYPPVARIRSAEILNLLSIAVDAGRPLPSALSTLARYHFDKNLRQKLLLTRNEIEQGADVWTSLSDARLLSEEETQAVAICSSNRSRAWTMRRLAAWKRDQILRRHEMAISLVEPVLVLLITAAVLFIGVAFYQFLAHLVHSLA